MVGKDLARSNSATKIKVKWSSMPLFLNRNQMNTIASTKLMINYSQKFS
jgi:hypothetical protein